MSGWKSWKSSWNETNAPCTDWLTFSLWHKKNQNIKIIIWLYRVYQKKLFRIQWDNTQHVINRWQCHKLGAILLPFGTFIGVCNRQQKTTILKKQKHVHLPVLHLMESW
jgi:hypothetical protein